MTMNELAQIGFIGLLGRLPLREEFQKINCGTFYSVPEPEFIQTF